MKKKIVIASVLKPVDDVRAFWKFSQSMAKTNKYEVNIIGNSTKKEIDTPGIYLHPHLLTRTNWLVRLFIRPKILFKILSIRPSLLIITTHELIVTALIARVLTRCKVVYDVQENYSSNLKHLSRSIIKTIYAEIIRFKENLSKKFINEFWLAEKCYDEELYFVRNKNVILENKAISTAESSRNWNQTNLIFSGTISTYGGIKNAINVFLAIQKVEPETLIHIIGQVHSIDIKKWLLEQQKNHSNILLTISYSPIPYPEILDAISKANLGVIGYETNTVNRNKVPTKLYEYSRYRLPYLVSENTNWMSKGEELGGAIPVNYTTINAQEILKSLSKKDELFTGLYPESATWEYESLKLTSSLDHLIKVVK